MAPAHRALATCTATRYARAAVGDVPIGDMQTPELLARMLVVLDEIAETLDEMSARLDALGTLDASLMDIGGNLSASMGLLIQIENHLDTSTRIARPGPAPIAELEWLRAEGLN